MVRLVACSNSTISPIEITRRNPIAAGRSLILDLCDSGVGAVLQDLRRGSRRTEGKSKTYIPQTVCRRLG